MTSLKNICKTNDSKDMLFQILLATNVVQLKDNEIAYKDSIDYIVSIFSIYRNLIWDVYIESCTSRKAFFS